MATAIATAPLTLETYLQSSFHPDVDFVDGQIKERNLGEFDHGFLQGLIFSWFRPLRAQIGGVPVVEQRIRVSETSVRICDVAVIRTDMPREQVATRPPLVCIEIMSPEDRLSRAIKVLEDYRTFGVPNIWLIDPQERLAYWFGPGGLSQREDLILQVVGTEISMNVSELFAELDQEENKETV
jgi:Uma2 family endonuclease